MLIEAGKVETPAQAVPVMAAYMQSTAYNWGLSSEPQAGSCLGELGLPNLSLCYQSNGIFFKEWRTIGAAVHEAKH